jgi:UDP-N-acetylmuramoyl-tripeptide--D-alanyl-D-alanine ligase
VIAEFETTLGDIAESCGGRILYGDPRTRITHISSDSRELDGSCLFVPIVGETFDGHSFIDELSSKKKISCFITSRPSDDIIARGNDVGAVLCDDTLHALGNIARGYRGKFSIPFVGITGTNGKTTTKELLACALSVKGNVLKNEKNYNNEIGVPFTLFGLNSDHDIAVIEMGMNHTGEISRLSSYVRPDIAIITNAGEGHLEFLGSVENVARAKSEIMEPMKPGSAIVLNAESECFDIMNESAKARNLKVVTVGLANGDIRPERYTLSPSSTTVVYKGHTFTVPLYGVHNIHNIMAVLAVCEEFGADLSAVSEAFSKFQNVGKRSDVVEGSFILVNDTYNSNPLSLRYALRSLSEIYPRHRKIAVLADMKELGEHSKRCHENAGKEVKLFNYDLLYTFGEMGGWIADGALDAGMSEDCVYRFDSKGKLIAELSKTVHRDDAVLVKGSRSMKMEEVAEALLKLNESPR